MEILIGTTSSGISYHLRDIYSICRSCWNVVTYKWKVHNRKIEIITMTWNSCVTNYHGYVPLVANISRSFPHSRLISGFVTRLTQQVPLVEQELFTLPEHLSSPPVFSEVRVSYHLRDIYSICRSCWNVVTYKWKVHNRKIEIILNCRFRGVGQDMKRTYLYLWYPLFR
jgi:hypothetical protein